LGQRNGGGKRWQRRQLLDTGSLGKQQKETAQNQEVAGFSCRHGGYNTTRFWFMSTLGVGGFVNGRPCTNPAQCYNLGNLLAKSAELHEEENAHFANT
jgi:hypothetical protein